MQALRTFFRTLFKSATSPSYYADVIKAPFSFSLKYLFTLMALYALMLALFVGAAIKQFDVRSTMMSAADVYPKDLTLTLKNNKLSINKPFPYVIEAPKTFMGKNTMWGNVPLIVFESDKRVKTIEDVMKVKGEVILTETMAYVKKSGAEVRTYPLSTFSEGGMSGSLSRAQVDSFVEQLADRPFFAKKTYIPIIVSGIFFFMLLFGTAWFMLKLLVVALVVYIIVALFMKRKKLAYGKVYQIGMHALTLMFLLTAAQWLLYVQYLEGPVKDVVLIGWMLVCVSSASPAVKTVKALLPAAKPAKKKTHRTR